MSLSNTVILSLTMAKVNRSVDGAVGRRRYDSTFRKAQAARTGLAVLDAAGELFSERGYAATSIADVAGRAGVSPETVYRQFGSKRALLLRWLDTRIVGDEEPVPMSERAEVDAIRDEPDPDRRARLAARLTRRVHERSARAAAVVAAAAHVDPEIAVAWPELRRRGHADSAALLDLLTADTGIRPGLDRKEAAEFFDAVVGPETYQLLVDIHGWTGEQYERWLLEVLNRLLRTEHVSRR